MTIEQLLKDHDAEIRVGNKILVREPAGYGLFYINRTGKRNLQIAVVEDLEEALQILTEAE